MAATTETEFKTALARVECLLESSKLPATHDEKAILNCRGTHIETAFDGAVKRLTAIDTSDKPFFVDFEVTHVHNLLNWLKYPSAPASFPFASEIKSAFKLDAGLTILRNEAAAAFIRTLKPASCIPIPGVVSDLLTPAVLLQQMLRHIRSMHPIRAPSLFSTSSTRPAIVVYIRWGSSPQLLHSRFGDKTEGGSSGGFAFSSPISTVTSNPDACFAIAEVVAQGDGSKTYRVPIECPGCSLVLSEEQPSIEHFWRPPSLSGSLCYGLCYGGFLL